MLWPEWDGSSKVILPSNDQHMPMADEEDRLSNADLAEWKRRVHQTKWMDSSNFCAESKGNDTIIVPGEKKNTYPFIFGLCFRVAVPILGDTVSDTPPLKPSPEVPQSTVIYKEK